MLFPLPMRYQGKVSSVYCIPRISPKLTWTYSVAAIPDIVFPSDHKLDNYYPQSVWGVRAPCTFGLLHPWTALKWSLGLSHCYSRCQATWILAQEKQGPGVKSVSALEIWKAAMEFITHFDSTLLPQHCIAQEFSFILAALRACFLLVLGLSFFPIVSGWCPGIKRILTI